MLADKEIMIGFNLGAILGPSQWIPVSAVLCVFGMICVFESGDFWPMRKQIVKFL